MEIWLSHSGYQSEFWSFVSNKWSCGVLIAVTGASFVVWVVTLWILVNTNISEVRASPSHSGHTLHFHSLPYRPTHHIPSERGCSPTTPYSVTASISSSVRATSTCLQNWLLMFWHLMLIKHKLLCVEKFTTKIIPKYNRSCHTATVPSLSTEVTDIFVRVQKYHHPTWWLLLRQRYGQ